MMKAEYEEGKQNHPTAEKKDQNLCTLTTA